jgi:hypothetical protein
MGKTFNLLIRLLGVRGLRDTQCGLMLLTTASAHDRRRRRTGVRRRRR